ncbi:MAG: hypothetical protein D6798_14430 [Deltaproteobacteria bacterium]|nr:MAG: hypothetical protein D6798_14430 [Deltaproteobacteria bacterium]
MAVADLFEKLTLTQVARWLDIHPFELARIIGLEGSVRPELRFGEDEVDRLRDIAGVETWWTGELPVSDDVRGRALVRSLARLVVEHADGEDWSTRADNLFRGLEPADQWVVRRAINQLIREGVLVSVSKATGLHVRLSGDGRERLAHIADGSGIPESLESLWS